MSIGLYYSKSDKDCLGLLKETYDLCVRDEFNSPQSHRYLNDINTITDLYTMYFKYVATNYVFPKKK